MRVVSIHRTGDFVAILWCLKTYPASCSNQMEELAPMVRDAPAQTSSVFTPGILIKCKTQAGVYILDNEIYQHLASLDELRKQLDDKMAHNQAKIEEKLA